MQPGRKHTRRGKDGLGQSFIIFIYACFLFPQSACFLIPFHTIIHGIVVIGTNCIYCCSLQALQTNPGPEPQQETVERNTSPSTGRNLELKWGDHPADGQLDRVELEHREEISQHNRKRYTILELLLSSVILSPWIK